MHNFPDAARESLNGLISGVLSTDRFAKWKASVSPDVARVLNSYVFGEIFWRKTLGRPTSAKLADAFEIETWRDQIVLVGDIGGSAHWLPLHVPYFSSLWDGKDDDEYWRVSFMVPNVPSAAPHDGHLEDAEHTYITPQFNRQVAWKIPGGRYGIGNSGLRIFEPPGVAFVKTQAPAHFSFEVVLRSILLSP